MTSIRLLFTVFLSETLEEGGILSRNFQKGLEIKGTLEKMHVVNHSYSNNTYFSITKSFALQVSSRWSSFKLSLFHMKESNETSDFRILCFTNYY